MFFLGYGCIGLLPLVQLKLLWRFATPSTIGTILFVTTFSVVISTFCDANLSFRAVSADNEGGVSRKLMHLYGVRLARLILFAPIACALFEYRGVSLSSLLAILTLTAAYLLNYAFIYRNSGSVTKALRGEFSLRALCMLFPVIGALVFGEARGLPLGSACALLTQMLLVRHRFDVRFKRMRPNFKSALSRDVLSGILGLIYSSFCQTASALVLTPDEFAKFISIDRLVRAGLLVAEPCRLWFLRLSWLRAANFSVRYILTVAVVVASLSLLSIVFVFESGFANFIIHPVLDNPIYLCVSFFVSFVSFFSLCAFIRYQFISTLNFLLLTAVSIGALSYWLLFQHGPFVAAFAFEGVAFLFVLCGAAFARYPRFRD